MVSNNTRMARCIAVAILSSTALAIGLLIGTILAAFFGLR